MQKRIIESKSENSDVRILILDKIIKRRRKNMKKYEYKEIQSSRVDLKSLGQDGWELCGITNTSWFFKREISNKDIHIGLLVSCAYMRNAGNLQHRTIEEFAAFVENVMSDKPEYQKYSFYWNGSSAIETWIEKFHDYCKEQYKL